MRTLISFLAGTAMAVLAGTAAAQMPSDLIDKVKAIGRVVNPPATAALYASRVDDPEPYQGVKVQRDISYGPAERNLLDVFTPDGTAARARERKTPTRLAQRPAPRPGEALPVLIFVHGGAFQAGNRRGPGSPFYDNIMLWAVRNGMIGVNVTYRLAPQNPWPAGAQDLGSAVKWVSSQIAQRGGDPKRVFLMGHSAGAVHVATYVAQERFHQVPGSGLAGALMLSGIYDITKAESNPPLKSYFGEDAAQFADRSSLPGLVASKVPLWMGYAELDPPDFETQFALAKDALCKAGKCPAGESFPNHSHMSEVYSIHTDDDLVGDSLLGFLHSH